ncbi:unnamed protein product [Musa hybrid cultivar]
MIYSMDFLSLSSFAHPLTSILQQKRDSNTNHDSYSRSRPSADHLPVGASTRAVEDQACSLLRSCVSFPRLTQIHAHFVRHAIYSSNLVAAKLVSACFSLDRPSYADRVFAHVPRYVGLGRHRNALLVFDHMPDKDVVAWNVMLSSYACLDLSESMIAFHRMQLHGLKPDKVMVVTMLSAIADLGMLDSGKWFHEYVKKNEIAIDAYVGNARVDMYAKCGSIQDARLVFDEIIRKNISCYNSMIFGLAAHGLGEEALEILTDAERTGIGIDDITMTAVLTACSHSGLVEEGLKYFKTMQNVYGIEPKKEHYGCIVDLLGRAGRFDEAMQIIEITEDDSFILGTLAAACRTHGNLELANELVKNISKLDPTNCGFLVLQANAEAASGRWEEAVNVRRLIKDTRIKKRPSCSWIEVGNEVHKFVASDNSHLNSVKSARYIC